MLRRPEYYANKKTTLYDLLSLYADDVEIIVQDKNGRIIASLDVRDAKVRPHYYLFDVTVLERGYSAIKKRLLVKLDYAE